jgi:hypothetical protein
MISVRVNLDVRTIVETRKLSERETRRAIARGLNRGHDTGRTMAKREISKKTRIPQRDVNSRLWVRGANPNYLIAEIGALPYSPNLRKFRPTQNAKGTAATAWEHRKTYRHAFMLPSGKVVARRGKSREDIKPLYGPSVPRTFMREDVSEAIIKAATDRVVQVTEYEITRRLGQRG